MVGGGVVYRDYRGGDTGAGFEGELFCVGVVGNAGGELACGGVFEAEGGVCGDSRANGNGAGVCEGDGGAGKTGYDGGIV